jgi:hypothetical protein
MQKTRRGEIRHAQKKLARPRALLRTAATRTHRSGMSLYEQDEPLAGATAEKPAGEADLVVPDYAPAPAPIDPNAAAEKSCLDVIATVYPDADAVNKVAAAESAALQTRMCVWTQGAGRPAAPPLLHVVVACLAERHRRSRLGVIVSLPLARICDPRRGMPQAAQPWYINVFELVHMVCSHPSGPLWSHGVT